jgi:exonuclease SbcC
VQILAIHLKNIKSHRDTELSFSPGINVLTGPNGVGKSTVFEAIGYALFGVDAQKFVGNVERFISIGAKKGEITVEFALDGDDRYRVSRTVGAGSRWLLYREVGGDFEVEEHKDAAETEERLKKLLGLDNGRPLAEQFELVIGPFQNEFLGPFTLRQPAKRRDAFDAILGIDAWRKTFTETGSLVKAIKNRVDVLQAGIAVQEEQVAVLPARKEELQKAEAEREQTGKARNEKSAELKVLQARLDDLDGREKSIAAMGNEIEVLKGRITDGGQKIEVQQQRAAEAEQALRVVESSRSGKKSFEKAEALLGELRGREKRRRELEQELAGLDKQATGLQGQMAAESRSLEKARADLDGERQRLDAARKTLQVGDEILGLSERLPVIRKELAALRGRQGQLGGRRSSLEEGSEKLAEGICPFFKEPCQNVAGKEPRDVFSARLQELDRELVCLIAEIENLQREEAGAEKAESRIRETRGQLQALEEQAAGLARRQNDLREREEGVRELQKRHGELSNRLKERRTELAEFAGLEGAIEQAEKEKALHREARDAFYAHLKQAEDLETRRETLQRFRKLLEDLQSSLAGKEGELAGLAESYDPLQHAQDRRRKEILLGELGTLEQKMAGLKKDWERLSAEIAGLRAVEKEITAKRASVRSLGRKEKLVKFLRNRVFKNVSGYLSERFREQISLRADRIYRTIAEADEELIWGDDYRVVLRDLHEERVRERSDDQLSGGQMMSAVVALRLALLQTIGARIAFFDEPTSNLDIARRENLARAFRSIDVGREEVAEHWYDQLFLVSHDVAFSEITDQTIALGDF